MAIEIRKAFQDLAAYADVVSADPEKAERLRQKQAEIDQFLAEEGLDQLSKPHSELARFQKEQVEQRHTRFQNHLAAVAQEAIRVEGDNFAHSTTSSVVRSLRESMASGDPRLNSDYTNATLGKQIFTASKSGFYVSAGQHGNEQLRMPVKDLVDTPDFQGKFGKYEGWVDTFRYAGRVLPPGADTSVFMFLLMSYNREVGPDLRQFPTVQGRVSEIQRGLLGRTAA